jgi:3-dehydroquinate dehydratase/shikimate dehydrogenase
MAQVIASILARGRAQAVSAARRAAFAGADWVELRLDRWSPDEDLEEAIGAIRLPVLVAIRMPKEGGYWTGSLGERRELFSRALAAGASGIDLEDWESWTPSVGRNRLRLMVRSYHNLTTVPADLASIQDRLFDAQGTVAKIACTAPDLADAAPLLDLLGATDPARRPTVAFAMGRTAWPTRFLAAMLGAPFIYASVPGEPQTAVGQVSVDHCVGLLRAHQLTGSTALYGLIGKPVLQSLGPWLHNRAMRRLDVDGLYLPFETSRPEAVLGMLPRTRLRGLSVTAPHKQTMAQQCHKLSPEASATGVVNTLTFEAHGMIVGHNTDVAGVLGALRRAGVGPVEQGSVPACVLGTGGAARAGAFALLRLGYRVTMLGRSLEPVRSFAAHHGVALASLKAAVLDELQPKVVVHATPVGSMALDPTVRILPEWDPKPGVAVLDMVYRPARTRLLRDVARAGGVAIPGREMFLTQASAQVELFTGSYLAESELADFLAGGVPTVEAERP